MVEKSATVTFGAEYRPTTQLLSNIWWRIRASNFLSPIKWLIGQWKDGELNDYEREASPVGASDPLRWWGRHAEKFPVSSDNARRVFVISAASSAEWETLRRSHPIVTAQRNYTVSGKKWNHSIFASNFAKILLANFQNYFTNRLSSKFLAMPLYKIFHHTSNSSLHYLVKW